MLVADSAGRATLGFCVLPPFSPLPYSLSKLMRTWTVFNSAVQFKQIAIRALSKNLKGHTMKTTILLPLSLAVI